MADKQKEEKKAAPAKKSKKQPVRLYVKGVFVGYRRNLREHKPHTAIMRVEGVNNRKDTSFYLGKRVAYIFKAQKEKQGSKYRVIWGRIGSPHGNTGAFRAKFRRNLPPQAMGHALRVMLYPSRV
jgi:large subunit ribosomal protein L35Ae